MLSFARQASYWALSLCAVGVFKFIQSLPAPEAIDYFCEFVIIFLILQDTHFRFFAERNQAERTNLYAKMAYCSTLGAAIIALGYVAQLLANGPMETKSQREMLIHIRLAFIVLAEAEWWRTQVSIDYNFDHGQGFNWMT